ncbi:MAG: hypothetical protein HZB13_00875 [Acidobacteria bacterium]|nr:hypothetical protein [Acidobacteriota bacterium]
MRAATAASDKIASQLAITRILDEVAMLESRIATVDSNHSSEIGRGFGCGVALFFIAIVFAFTLVDDSHGSWIPVFVIVGFGLICVFNGWRALHSDPVQPLRAQLDALQRDLAKHQSIVDARPAPPTPPEHR